ncbi:hypothetical protein [Cryobacterium sp. GrIS_2_6]|uniref:hypothetical protein n=1 Tax=Cryobacterium sp. GrIS_2_6 TaxID=3162785 RepID=UPI002DF7777C|nr:hypothetical protein [Cryobacterium psychrotolerans]
MATIAIVTAMMCGASGALAIPQDNPGTVTSVVSAGTNGAGKAADAVLSYATSALPDVFGGVSLTNNGNSLVVHLTSIGPVARSAINTVAALTGVVPTFVTARASLTKLKSTMDGITAAADKLSASGITLESWTIDGQSGLIDVNILNGTAAQDASVATEFGSLVQVGNVGQLPIAAADRGADYSPFDGGDWVTDNAEDCSTGVPVIAASGYFMLTAAHCFPVGATVYNRSATIPRGDGAQIGTVTNIDGTSNGLDAELVHTTANSGLIWFGYTLNPTSTVISTNPGGSPAGAVVCNDGAFEGQVCDTTVAQQGCVTFDVGPRCHILVATGSNAQDVGLGDSGGPVIRSGTNQVVGTVTGLGGTQARCANWYPQTVRTCGSTLYYTDINAEMNEWGLTIG